MSKGAAVERTVLVIEDHPQLAKALSGLAKACGLAAVITATAVDARAWMRESWTGVIADVLLPDGNALDVLEDHRNETGPTLVLTGNDSRDIVNRAFDLRASYMPKPIDPSRIKRWLLDLSPFEPRFARSLAVWHVRYALTVAELNVLELAARGAANDEVARQLHVSIDTVKSHVKSLLRKTGDDTLAHAALRLFREDN